MKSSIEITKTLSALGWCVYRLHQVTGESEFNIKYAINHQEETDTRTKIAAATGKTFEEIFGEEK